VTSPEATLSGAVEGLLDEVVLRSLIEHVGATPASVYGKAGKRRLLQRLNGYNHAARQHPWFVLVDLNSDAECAPPARAEWLPQPAPLMCFRIAVRAVESWLLADRERLARFLGVSSTLVPTQPEAVDEPKRLMVQLARSSRRRAIREDMAPRTGSGRDVGPAYTARLIEFVIDSTAGWRPEKAAQSSDSLMRCIRRLRDLISQIRVSAARAQA